MTDRISEKDLVITEELLMSQLIQLDAVTQLLIEKGVFREDEFILKLKQVQAEYLKKSSQKG